MMAGGTGMANFGGILFLLGVAFLATMGAMELLDEARKEVAEEARRQQIRRRTPLYLTP